MILGNEVFFRDHTDLIRGKRVGLVTNPSGVDSRLRMTADRLREIEGTTLGALFGPEHGITGDAPDATPVASSAHPRLRVLVYSLYGDTLRPTEEMLESLDVVLVDIQDVGVRFYTFVYTLAYVMEACAKKGIPVVVLDRPNPLGGEVLEGNLLDPAFRSFEGAYPILLRHGMTVGELADLFNVEFHIGAELTLIPMEGWHRDTLFAETGLLWVPPSPNMPTPDTVVVYPGTCLFEGTEVSEGRGTCKPFEQIGAPYVDSWDLAGALNRIDLPGAIFRPTSFIPTSGKYRDQRCYGVHLHVTDPRGFQPVRTGLEMVASVQRAYPERFVWLQAPKRPAIFFDCLMGTDAVRIALEDGISAGEIETGWQEEIRTFREMRAPYLIY